MKRFIDMEQSPLSMFLLISTWLCSVSYTANEYSIYHFCIVIKDFSISFSSLIIVKDFETVTFYVLLPSTDAGFIVCPALFRDASSELKIFFNIFT